MGTAWQSPSLAECDVSIRDLKNHLGTMASRQISAVLRSAARPRMSSRLPSTTTALRPLSTTISLLTKGNMKAAAQQQSTMIEDDNLFGFARHNPRPPKPRSVGVTEIRGPYYSAMGKRYLQDVLETMGYHIDGLKFAGGSFSLFPEDKLRELIDLAHEYGVYVSTGGWIEHLLATTPSHIPRYLSLCKALGFDVLEISTGFLSLPPDDWLRLVDTVQSSGLRAKPEIGIQFGAGGDTDPASLAEMGTSGDPGRVVGLGRQFVEQCGVERIMVESEGITENVAGGRGGWRTDVIRDIVAEVGGLPREKVMFEAADPAVFNWYVREFGADVNLFVDHSQIVQLSCLREGIWGMGDTFGKVVSFR
ncbi:hypothetical protein VTK26DRAFT_5720 [Humicola hyalothermophila]